MTCGVGCRHSSDLTLLWLWPRPVATVPIRPLAWEPPYAGGAAQEKAKRQKKQKTKKKQPEFSYINKSEKGKFWTELSTNLKHKKHDKHY